MHTTFGMLWGPVFGPNDTGLAQLRIDDTLIDLGCGSAVLLAAKASNFSENDKARRNTITNLLVEWELISHTDAGKTEEPTVPLSQLKILSFKEKDEWDLTPKYNIGNKRDSDELDE